MCERIGDCRLEGLGWEIEKFRGVLDWVLGYHGRVGLKALADRSYRTLRLFLYRSVPFFQGFVNLARSMGWDICGAEAKELWEYSSIF